MLLWLHGSSQHYPQNGVWEKGFSPAHHFVSGDSPGDKFVGVVKVLIKLGARPTMPVDHSCMTAGNKHKLQGYNTLVC